MGLFSGGAGLFQSFANAASDIWSDIGGEDAFGGGRWMNNDLVRFTGIPGMIKDWDENWGGANWQARFGYKPDQGYDEEGDSSSGSGTSVSAPESMGEKDIIEEERARRDAIRRMLAGRYGRAETNLTGGSGYEQDKQEV